MRIRTYRTLQALILAVLGFYLLDKLTADNIQFFTNPRLILVILLAALALFILAQRVLFTRPAAPKDPAQGEPAVSGWWKPAGLILILVPLLVDGVYEALPGQFQRPTPREINSAIPLPAGLEQPAIPGVDHSEQRSILDWLWLYRKSAAPGMFDGEMADVTGMVAYQPGSPAGVFWVYRPVISNSAGDAQVVGMEVAWAEATGLGANQWVRVRGPVQADLAGGRATPRILAQSVDPVPDLAMPYLAP